MNTETQEQPQDEPGETSREIKQKLKRLIHLRRGVSVFSFRLVAYCLLWFIFSRMAHTLSSWITFSIVFFASIVIVSTMSAYRRVKFKKIVRELSSINDVTYIGALIDAISVERSSLTRPLEPFLINLLYRLQASHSHLLYERHRRKLYAMLRHGKNKTWALTANDFPLAILRALEQVGDKEAIPHVQNVVASNRDKEVRQAAEECLVYLRQRAEQQNATDTLLRPSNPANAAPDTLLRASVARQDEKPELLLRANAVPDERNI